MILLRLYKEVDVNILDKCKKALSLAETLVIMVVLGIVSISTIPVVMGSADITVTTTKFRKDFAVIALATKRIMLMNKGRMIGAIEGSDADATTSIGDLYEEYLEIKKRETGSYNFTAHTWPATNTNYAVLLQLDDGTLLSIRPHESDYATNCNKSYGGSPSHLCAEIHVDVNGNEGPNKWGYDIFGISVTQKGLVPWGNDDAYTGTNTCNKTNQKGCAAAVLSNTYSIKNIKP